MISKYDSVFKKEAIGDKLVEMKLITLAMLLVTATCAAAQSLNGGTPQAGGDPQPTFAQQRLAMVARLRAERGIGSRIADAFAAVPRERFVPQYLRQLAYDDSSLPMGGGIPLPSPSDLALALVALDVGATDDVLVIGAADGYAAALVSRIAARVEAVELDAADGRSDRAALAALGYSNITLAGPLPASSLASRGPFDRILVNGAVSTIPATFLALLAPVGRIVASLSDPSGVQMMVALQKQRDGSFSLRAIGRAFFPPIQLAGGP